MKRSYIYIALISCIALMSGCLNIEELEEPAQKVHKTFYAQMEDSPLAKTVLGDKGEDGIRPVLWMPEDKIGIAPDNGTEQHFDIFVSSNKEITDIAEFSGSTALSSVYCAIYPYDEKTVIKNGAVTFNLATEQKYKAGSFDQGVFPMIARSSDVSENGLVFMNLCGVLEVNLKGEEKVTSITFSTDSKVSGDFSVRTDYKDFPEVTAEESGVTYMTLNCGDGVQLKESEATPLYLVLPPGEYDSFTLLITTADGKKMFKQNKKPLNLKRSYVTSAGALAYVESMTVDLSMHGTANCYIVPGIGLYSFNASVIGNGTYGIIPGASFHTEDPKISPESVEVLWEADKSGEKLENGTLLNDVVLTSDGNVTFMATGKKGNALVAVKGAKGSILWSWHLWFTDTPKNHLYVNSYGKFNVLDRNLGATRADHGTGDEWMESIGTIYQWGRKDPFLQSTYSILRSDNNSNGPFTISSAIQNPSTLGLLNGGNTVINAPSWVDVKNSKLWTSSTKTIYDPCPVGYRVPENNIWRGFTVDGNDATSIGSINASDSHTNGFNFIYDGTNTAWYPATPRVTWSGSYTQPSTNGWLWTTTPGSSFRYQTTPRIVFNSTFYECYSFAVRCVKDEGHVDAALPVVKVIGVKDITVESAKLAFEIISSGASEVTESGVIYGIEPGLSLDNGTKITAGQDCLVEIAGLKEGFRYYAVAYATNSFGTSYTEECAFYTRFENCTSLSACGTANCYIVPGIGPYSFNASVIGNGTYGIIPGASFHTEDPNISPASVAVLWETDKSNAKVENGTLLTQVELTPEGNVTFIATGLEGNALVAVKGAKGSILWSWHLWFTDPPKDQIYESSYGRFNMLDRNLGATRADHGTGDEWMESIGTIYQWGRKDPFMHSTYSVLRSDDNGKGPFTIISSIQHPDMIGSLNNGAYNYPSWVDEKNSKLWTSSTKTIYDPCPAGYKVPDMNVWRGFTEGGTNTSYLESINASAILDHGIEFIYDSSNTTWYPAVPMVDWNAGYHEPKKHGRLWTTIPERSFKYEVTPKITFDNTECWENYAIAVRCVKDGGYVNAALPVVEIISVKESTVESVKLAFEIISSGSSEVTESGVIYGTESELSLVKGTKIIAGKDCLVEITGLKEGSKYYAVAYAINSYGISYSEVCTFYTRLEKDINLSNYGTANCYIVPPSCCSYTFDCTVKGNGTEEVGDAEYVDVIWETNNTADPVKKGGVIESVELLDEKVKFTLPSNSIPGNALIVVKNITGKIIWSWHIWVTEFDMNKDYDIYPSGVMMMDRNLGALGTQDSDALAFGLYYQWGRKDPFPGKGSVSGNTFAATSPEGVITYVDNDSSVDLEDYATRYPYRVIKNSTWNNKVGYWTANKTQYDPCPPGWRVPGRDVWDGFDSSVAYYPDAGYINNGSIKTGKNYWTNDLRYYWNGTSTGSRRYAYDELPVRCMKDAVFTVSNNSAADAISDSYVVVSGNLAVSDDTQMQAKGFVCSARESDPKLYTEGCIITDEGPASGDFTSTIKGLKPGTTYYIRAYAKGGYNVRYGNVITLKTKEGADGEGYLEDDDIFEW